MASSNGGGNARKIGRNKRDCERYTQQGRLAKNKARTLARHLKRVAQAAEKRAFRKAHNGMSKARYAAAMKVAPRWEAA
jgi:hypothetical protein